MNEVKTLTATSMMAFRQLKATYNELEAFVSGSGKAQDLPELDALIDRYEDLRDSYRKFDNKRSKLTMAGFDH